MEPNTTTAKKRGPLLIYSLYAQHPRTVLPILSAAEVKNNFRRLHPWFEGPTAIEVKEPLLWLQKSHYSGYIPGSQLR
jgi:hypothetical protein